MFKGHEQSPTCLSLAIGNIGAMNGEEYELIGFCRTGGSLGLSPVSLAVGMPMTGEQAEVPLNYLNITSRMNSGPFFFLW